VQMELRQLPLGRCDRYRAGLRADVITSPLVLRLAQIATSLHLPFVYRLDMVSTLSFIYNPLPPDLCRAHPETKTSQVQLHAKEVHER
jgi:hypothetical protein